LFYNKEVAYLLINLSSDGSGNIFFNDVLFMCMKKSYGIQLIETAGGELTSLLRKLEGETRY